MKYVAYTRSSIVFKGKSKEDKETIREDVRHEVQVEAIKKYAEDDELIIFSESDVSRDTPIEKRSVLKEALNSLKNGDTFIIWKLDRLCAGVSLLEDICAIIGKKQASMISVTEPNLFDYNPSAQLRIEMGAVIAKYEINNIRFRVKKALKLKKANGQRVGTIAYGYKASDIGKQLLICHEEQGVMDEMERLRREYLTYREVAESLNTRGILKRSGSLWNHTAVYRILHNRQRHREPFLEAFQAEVQA